MSTKYLDKIGLSYFWTKLKAWIASAASNLVHRTGDESISGLKEFGNSYYDSTRPSEIDWESSSLIVRFQNYVKGSGVPAANKYANLLFMDKEGDNVNWSGRLGAVETDILASGQHRVRLVVYKNEVIDGEAVRDNAGIVVGYDADGNKFATAPATSSLRTNGTDIVTRNWIPTDDRIVHTTGTDSLSGVKNVNVGVAAGSGICLQDSMNFISSDSNFLQGVVPADGKNHFATVNFFDYAANGVDITTSNYKNYLTGIIQQALRTDGSFDFRIFSVGRIDGTYITSILGVGCDADGIKYANAPSTSLDRTADTDILTRDWIPKDTRIVHTTGNETIAGTKIFSSTIIGSVSGNAATATKFATARNINGVSFDGSVDITVADSTKLPLAGGTMTGNITMSASKSVIFDLSATAPTVNTPRNIPIQFKSKSVASDFVFSNYPFFEIPSTQDANYGMGVGFCAGGLTIVGSGEAGKNIVSAESLDGYDERLVFVSDTVIDIYTNCHNIVNRVKTTIDNAGNFSGKASNVTGTVAIANGGTGATTRLNAVKALTNESVGTAATFFLTITDGWGKAGFTSVNQAKTVLGLKSAAYTESSDYAQDSAVVHNTGNENISGWKRFDSSLCVRSSVVKGTAPSSTINRQISFSEKDGDTTLSHRFGCIESTVNSSNSVSMFMRVYKAEAGSTDNAGIGIVYLASGDVYTVAPTPATADNSTKIATTEYVKAQGYVDSEDVSSTFTWESGESPAHFFAYRVGKIVHIFYQGAGKAHSGGDRLGTTTLTVAGQTYIPFSKNAMAYGTVAVNPLTGSGSYISVSVISSTTASGRIYFNGSFLIS